MKWVLPLFTVLLMQGVMGCGHREGPARPMTVTKVTLGFPPQSQSWTFTNGQFVAQIATLNSGSEPACIYVGTMDVLNQQGAPRTFEIYHVHDPANILLGGDVAVKNGRELLAFLARQGFPTNKIFANCKGR
jgi:hypothetical protein